MKFIASEGIAPETCMRASEFNSDHEWPPAILWRRTPLFWRLQFLGWFAFAILTLPLKISLNETVSGIIGAFILRDGFSFLITLVMRKIYHCVYENRHEPIWIAGTVAVVSLSAGIAQIPVFYLLGDVFPFEEETIFSRSINLGIFYYRTGLFTCWSILYFGIKEMRAVTERDLRLALIESEKRNAQLQMLRSQMNPHFLFNALNAIQSEIGKPKTPLKETVKGLTEYLRFSLDHSQDEFIPMGLEYEAMLSFFKVETLRFGDDLIFECKIEKAARSALVPGIILQPLVENAIKYGQKTSDLPLRVRVEISFTQPDELRIVIANTGEWVEPDAFGHDKISHVGLENIRRRLGLLYGDKHRLTIEHSDGWVIVELKIPLLT